MPDELPPPTAPPRRRGLHAVERVLHGLVMRSELVRLLEHLLRVGAAPGLFEDQPEAGERADIAGVALQRFGYVGRRALEIAGVEAHRRASVPALRPVGVGRDYRVEQLQGERIVFGCEGLQGAGDQQVGDVGAGLHPFLLQGLDDAGRLVFVLGFREPVEHFVDPGGRGDFGRLRRSRRGRRSVDRQAGAAVSRTASANGRRRNMPPM